MPESSYLYSLPYNYYEDFGIRKYGFHGTSHKYVSRRAADILENLLKNYVLFLVILVMVRQLLQLMVEIYRYINGLHSISRCNNGYTFRRYWSSFNSIYYGKTGKTADEVLTVLNKESGLLGISGTSSDLRDLLGEAANGDERAELALDIFASRIHKYIGSYAARMHGVDVIVFTAGVGENSSPIRAKILEGLEFMGVYWDLRKMNLLTVKKLS